jgi:hypothetical protein
MSRGRCFVKPAIALLAAGALALAASGCAFVKPNSLAVSQPQGIGPVRVHFNLCTFKLGSSEEVCGLNEADQSLQYLAGIAVPPGSVPPTTFTAVPVGGGAPIVFTRNDEVATEIAAASVTMQEALEKIPPENPEEAALLEQVFGRRWPPSGLQGVGYLSAPVQEVKGATGAWSVDADFGLPTAADGGPFPGPFATAIAWGAREVTASQPGSRPVRCTRVEGEKFEQKEGEALCSGGIQQAQIGTADLRIAAPAKPGKAFVGGSAELAFSLKFAATAAAAVPTFALSATTTLKGGKTKLGSPSFTPGPPNPTGKVTVSVPSKAKPGTYSVTLTATTPQGGTATQVAKLKVTKPKLKLSGVKVNAAKGTATLEVKVPSGGRLTIAGKGVAKLKKKAKKAKTLKVKIASTATRRPSSARPARSRSR